MKERPILFKGEMVRAILEGRKTQTRRMGCPYGQIGDRLWVKETFAHGDAWYDDRPGLEWKNCRRDGKCTWVDYAADFTGERDFPWRPSIFMPRWASRITLEITDVRVERLQEISEADALAEGVAPTWQETWWQGYCEHPSIPGELLHQTVTGDAPPDWMIEPHRMNLDHLKRTAVDEYRLLWGSINSFKSWAANPWVWVIEFKRI